MSIEFSIFDLSRTYAGRKQFDCEHTVINKFVHDSMVSQVKRKLSLAYLLTDSASDDRIVGFFTVAHHSISAASLSGLQLGSLPRSIPCTRLVMLGVDKVYKGKDLGRRLLKQALLLTKAASNQMGCYGLYLDADSKALGFYLRLGFVLLEGDKSPPASPMFMPVASIA
jgi:GNAT superfamily N-acetyltransferase